MKEFLKRLGIIIYTVALIIGFFTLSILWIIYLHKEVAIVTFVSKWLVAFPIVVLAILVLIKLLYDGFKWLFIEPFKK